MVAKNTLFFNLINLLYLFFRDKLIPESMIRNIIYQVLQGLAFIHKHGELTSVTIRTGAKNKLLFSGTCTILFSIRFCYR